MIPSESWLVTAPIRESEIARSSECRDRRVQKDLDTADMVRDRDFAKVK